MTSLSGQPASAGLAERAFHGAVVAAITFELAFVAAVIAALVLFTDPASMVKAVATPTAQSAIKLTLVTVTLSSALSVLLAIPAAYGLAFWRIPGRAVLTRWWTCPS
jgi:ABC-type sulfate transport system permease component